MAVICNFDLYSANLTCTQVVHSFYSFILFFYFCLLFYFMLSQIYYLHVNLFWGNSGNSIKIFRQQKKILRILTKSKKTESCRKLFKEMKILPFYCQYIFSLLMYVVNNKHSFTKNLEIHSHNTRNASNLHVPAATLSIKTELTIWA